MAEFPSGVYSPRTKENKAGVVYTPAKTTWHYAEDITKLDDEVVAIEEFLSPKDITADIDLALAKKALVNPPAINTEAGFFTLDFADNALNSIYFIWHIPEDYQSEGPMHFHLHFFVNAPNIGDEIVEWKLDYLKKEDVDIFEFGSPATLALQKTIEAIEDNKEIHETLSTNFTTTGWIPEDHILLKLYRDGGVGNDTYSGDARLFKMHIVYRKDKVGATP